MTVEFELKSNGHAVTRFEANVAERVAMKKSRSGIPTAAGKGKTIAAMVRMTSAETGGDGWRGNAGSQPPGRGGVQVTPNAVTCQAVVALRDRLDDPQVSASYVDEIAVARDRLLSACPAPAEELDKDPQEQLEHGVAGQRRQPGVE